jgi:hypothetical protein
MAHLALGHVGLLLLDQTSFNRKRRNTMARHRGKKGHKKHGGKKKHGHKKEMHK